jgi:hypothetical protein
MDANTRRVTRPRDADAVAHDVTADPNAAKQRRTSANRQSASGIYSMDDEELAAIFRFTGRIGNGNWGQVWAAEPVDPGSGIGTDSAIRSGLASGGRVAIKMVERATNPVSLHR